MHSFQKYTHFAFLQTKIMRNVGNKTVSIHFNMHVIRVNSLVCIMLNANAIDDTTLGDWAPRPLVDMIN